MNKVKLLVKVRGKVIYPILICLFNIFDRITKTRKNQWCFFFTEKHYSDNCKYYYEYLRNNHSDIDSFLLIKHKKLYLELKDKNINVFYQYSFRGFKMFLTSKNVIISNGSSFFYFLPYILDVTRKNIINLWHGIPLKKLGLKVDSFREQGKECYLQKNSLFFVSSNKELGLMNESFLIPIDNLRITGAPRTDVFFKEQDSKMDELYTNILYAPTWREYGNKTRFFPFDDFDIHELLKFCEKYKVRFYMRAHRYDMESLELFLSQSDISKEECAKYIYFAGQDKFSEVQDLLFDSSILVTDYSSLYLDYLLLNKPMIFIPYDFEEFKKYRGYMFDYDEYTPGAKTLTFQSFKNEIIKCIEGRDTFIENRLEIKEKFHEYEYGSACEEITLQIKKINQ